MVKLMTGNPLIGITTSRTTNQIGTAQTSVNEDYIRAITDADGSPLLIPNNINLENLEDLVIKLDGIMFSGGGDIDPGAYGSQYHPKVNGIDHTRDQLELDLFKIVHQKEIPYLGICRGLQIVNVALGGTLYEDISDQRPGSLQHQTPKKFPRDHLAHTVIIDSDNLLERNFNDKQVKVNSMHHQGIKTLAPRLKPIAYAPDGLIEACEQIDHRFGVCVQWHPECIPDDANMQQLFKSFILAAATKSLLVG